MKIRSSVMPDVSEKARKIAEDLATLDGNTPDANRPCGRPMWTAYARAAVAMAGERVRGRAMNENEMWLHWPGLPRTDHTAEFLAPRMR